MIVSHCYPMLWITYTHISKRNSGKNLPIYVQVYYSFVDGIHIGEFVDSLEKYFENLYQPNSSLADSQQFNIKLIQAL